MGEIRMHSVLAYGFLLGGPKDGWSGLAGPKVYYQHEGHSWMMPEVTWSDEAMRQEDHPDHFQAQAENVLAEAGLGDLELQYIGDDYEDVWGFILAAVIIIDPSGPITPEVFEQDRPYDGALLRGMQALGLNPVKSEPTWILGQYDA